jgi:hypothetical protein
MLMDRGVIRGEVRRVTGPIQFQVVRPGVTQDVACIAESCTVVTTSTGTWGVLTRLHQTGGFGYGMPLLNVWGALAGLVSLGLFLMGGSGVYLWFAGRDLRRVGTALLVGAVAFTGYLIVSMRM